MIKEFVHVRKSKTALTPNVTNPGPRAFGRKPSTLSFSVGSDLENDRTDSAQDGDVTRVC